MLKKYSIILILFSISIEILFSNQDLSGINIYKKYTKIDKELNFYWDKHLNPGDDFSNPDEIVNLPFDWSIQEKYSVWGKGTFSTKIFVGLNNINLGLKMFYTLDEYKVYVNGKLLAQNYNPENKSRISTLIIKLPEAEVLDIVIQISNLTDNHGGISNPPVIGEYESLIRDLNRDILFDAFIFGALLITGLLYVSFYFSKRDEKSALSFGLFAIVLSLRTLLYGEHTLLMYFTNLSLELEATLGHLTFYLSVPLLAKFISEAFPFKYFKKILLGIYSISFIYVVFALIFKHSILVQLLFVYQVFTLIVGVLVISILIIKAKDKNIQAIITLLGFAILLFAATNDILLAQEIIVTVHLTPIGMVFFVISQGVLLCWNIAKSFKKSEKLAGDLSLANKSFKRFVPEEFLNILNRAQVTDIKLGDHVQLNMTVMFCDIREFTSLSEQMSPRENFLFINSFLERIGPVIRINGGFIDKYMGDGIMSLFPEGADSAVNAAIEIQKALETYNKHRNSSGYDSIKLGIGINTGSLMLGTIGENERMDGTVISDAVNICSRIESITKEYGLSIAISENTYNSLFKKDHLSVRNIGKITLRGKKNPVCVYELYNTDIKEHIELKNKFKETFETAIEYFEKGKKSKAFDLFSEIITAFPEDLACINYLKKINDPNYENESFMIY